MAFVYIFWNIQAKFQCIFSSVFGPLSSYMRPKRFFADSVSCEQICTLEQRMISRQKLAHFMVLTSLAFKGILLSKTQNVWSSHGSWGAADKRECVLALCLIETVIKLKPSFTL